MIETTVNGSVDESAFHSEHLGNGGQSDEELLQKFVSTRDERAFEALVRRHGPMVHGVCRRVLHDAHAADDAFQATFLLLARKCHSIRAPELLANWLFGVAHRTAIKARENAARRRVYERQAAKLASHQPHDELVSNELASVVDEEINRLPMKYRAPLVLCYFEGVTNARAAQLLGWPEGSISGRLAKARELLRTRLKRRGVNFSAGVLAVLFLQDRGAAARSNALAETTADGILANATGAEETAVLSPQVIELADEVLRTMQMSRAKAMVACLILLLLIGFAVVPGGIDLRAASFDAPPAQPASAGSCAAPADPADPAASADQPESPGPESGAACEAGGQSGNP